MEIDNIKLRKFSFNHILAYARRARVKVIEDNYCHFVFQGCRVESVNTNGYWITCVVKGKSPKKTNDNSLFNKNTLFICSKDEFLKDEDSKSFFKSFQDYFYKHKIWLCE